MWNLEFRSLQSDSDEELSDKCFAGYLVEAMIKLSQNQISITLSVIGNVSQM